MTKKAAALLLLLMSIMHCTNAQYIESPMSDTRDTIVLSTNNDTVPVFIYNSDEIKTKTSGSLIVHGPQDTASFDFTWQKYDIDSFTFVTFDNVTEIFSTKTNLDEGSYRVIIDHSSGYTDTLVAFLFINNFGADITNQNSEGKLNRTSYTCDFFRITSEAPADTLVYYDYNDNSKQFLASSIDDIAWNAETEDTDYPGLTKKTLNFFEYTKLAEKATITLTVTDKYGAIGRDTVEYDPIQVRAKMDEPDDQFLTEIIDEKYYNNEQTSSPHAVIFTNNSSSKVDSMVWKFGDNNTGYNADTIEHTYLFPGTYEPVLLVFNTVSGCVDSVVHTDGIEVAQYDFEMPNIFILNGVNIFRCLDISVTHFEIVIVSRWGQRVHEFKGDIRDWGGWNGKIKGSDRYAQSGVYYYYIKTMDGWDGWDGEKGKKAPIPRDVRNGFFHVFNTVQ